MNIANAPCSWGVLEFDLEGEVAAFGKVLDEMKETGYSGTELGDWGFMPTAPDRLRAELSARGLALLGAFVPVAFVDASSHAEGQAAALRTARLLAGTAGTAPFILLADANGTNPARTKNAGRIRPEHGLTESQWRTFADGVSTVARAVREHTGIRTVFHHHCAGFVETPAEIDRLLSLTDPGLVGLCLDTGHYAFGGGDPVVAIEKHGPRIWHMHFKDCDPRVAAESRKNSWDYFESVRRGIFCELGGGAVDFPGVLSALRAAGFNDWAVVEQDVLPGMGSPRECALRNRTYLRTLGL
jgi:inosose dehydratase